MHLLFLQLLCNTNIMSSCAPQLDISIEMLFIYEDERERERKRSTLLSYLIFTITVSDKLIII